jgi:hypothetical protein
MKIKNNIMKQLIKFLFGETAAPVDAISLGVHTTHPPTQISFCEWCNEFKVSMLHGKQSTHINN